MFIIKNPFLKYYKTTKTKCNEYFEKSLCQFRDVNAENVPSKHQFIHNRL